MPVYNWHCTECDMVWELFLSMTERDENPPTHCEKCDPDSKKDGTLRQVHFKGSLPKFKVTGQGAYNPDLLK